MAKKELKEQLKSYEGYINDIPLVIDPCKICKIYKEHNGWFMEHSAIEKVVLWLRVQIVKDGKCKEIKENE